MAEDQFFFFNDTATTEIYTLSLHDALPILLLLLGLGRHRSRIVSSGAVSRWWNLYLPSLLVLTRPADSRTSRCWEMACRDEPSPCLTASREQISNRVCPSRSLSSSRTALLVRSASALYTSLTAASIGKQRLAYQPTLAY